MPKTMLKGIMRKKNPFLPTLYVFRSQCKDKMKFLSILSDGTPIDFYSLTSTKKFNVEYIQDYQISEHAGFIKAWQLYESRLNKELKYA